MRKRWGRRALFALAITITWTLAVFHRAVLISPPIPASELADTNVHGQWFARTDKALNELFVWGTPYQRGYASGVLTRDLMAREESGMVAQLHEFFPNPLLRLGLMTALMRWFWGIDRWVEDEALVEMYGTGLSASHEYDNLLDSYSRQLAYHGLHEVGQMFVDVNRSDMGCTVFVVPGNEGFLVGRNFDFEGPRILDDEKIVKWIYPDHGHRIVGVTWAGMVGLVTGVNDQGVYVSLNAAGSGDFRRYGTPTTLATLKALQLADNAEAAVEILKRETTFITDIFVVGDRSHFYRLEKSPRRSVVMPLTTPTVIANHLVAPDWEKDRINSFRRTELTSQTRVTRGEQLLREPPRPLETPVRRMLRMLRDRTANDGTPLPLGSRQAIDSLIATHSVIYDSSLGVLYVSQGPSVAGGFIGFDLAATFARHGPGKIAGILPADVLVTPAVYAKVKESDHLVGLAEKELKKHHCEEATRILDRAASFFGETSRYFTARGDSAQCAGKMGDARRAWQEALRRHPAYAKQQRALERKLGT